MIPISLPTVQARICAFVKLVFRTSSTCRATMKRPSQLDYKGLWDRKHHDPSERPGRDTKPKETYNEL